LNNCFGDSLKYNYPGIIEIKDTITMNKYYMFESVIRYVIPARKNPARDINVAIIGTDLLQRAEFAEIDS